MHAVDARLIRQSPACVLRAALILKNKLLLSYKNLVLWMHAYTHYMHRYTVLSNHDRDVVCLFHFFPCVNYLAKHFDKILRIHLFFNL